MCVPYLAIPIRANAPPKYRQTLTRTTLFPPQRRTLFTPYHLILTTKYHQQICSNLIHITPRYIYSLPPVSYTHLDVYKRQALRFETRNLNKKQLEVTRRIKR